MPVSRAPSGTGSSRPASGSSTVNVAPVPGPRHDGAWCRRAPPRSRRRSRARARSRRRRASATGRPGRSARRPRAASSGSCPGPSSATSITAWPSRWLTRTVAGALGGVWLRTFASRLSTTWRSRSRSPITVRWLECVSRSCGSGSTRAPRRRRRERPRRRRPAPARAAGPGRAARAATGRRRARPSAATRARCRPSPARGPGPVARAAVEQLGVGLHRGQRRAQLVRRVATKRRSRCSDAAALGERLLDLAEHRVERPAEPADLGARVRVLHPAAEITGGDRRRGVASILRSGRRPTRTSQTRAPTIAADHDERDEQLDQEQAMERPVDVVERRGDDRASAEPASLDADAELGAALGRTDGELRDAAAVPPEAAAGQHRVDDGRVARRVSTRRADDVAAGLRTPMNTPGCERGELLDVARSEAASPEREACRTSARSRPAIRRRGRRGTSAAPRRWRRRPRPGRRARGTRQHDQQPGAQRHQYALPAGRSPRGASSGSAAARAGRASCAGS